MDLALLEITWWARCDPSVVPITETMYASTVLLRITLSCRAALYDLWTLLRQADSDFQLKIIYEADGDNTLFTPDTLKGIMGEYITAYVLFCRAPTPCGLG